MHPLERQVSSQVLDSCPRMARPYIFGSIVWLSSPIVFKSSLPFFWFLKTRSIFRRGASECLSRMRTMASSFGVTSPVNTPSISLSQDCRSFPWKIDRLPYWSHAAKQGRWLKGIKTRRKALLCPWEHLDILSVEHSKISWRPYAWRVHPMSPQLCGIHLPHGPVKVFVFVVPSTKPFAVMTEWRRIYLTQRDPPESSVTKISDLL